MNNNQQQYYPPPQNYQQDQQYYQPPPQQAYEPPKYDYEQQKPFLGGSDQEGGLFGNSRLGFIRKVYLILTTQLLITVMFCGIAMGSQAVRDFQANNLWLFITCWAIMLISMITIFCFPKIAAKVPTNYILLFTFTLCYSWMISMICGFYAEVPSGYQLVFIAAGLTCGIVIGLTIYAITTKTDFTTMGGLLWICCFALMFFGLFLWIFNSSVAWLNILYCCLGVILFGLYLIYDTQLIVGGKHRKFQLDYDQYVIGALILYVDIIQIFLYILSILSRAK